MTTKVKDNTQSAEMMVLSGVKRLYNQCDRISNQEICDEPRMYNIGDAIIDHKQ